ncbi:hypothetical protein [Rhodopirellula bahusiensis]|uniref:hypothetical protein n=1 Tax=Rhodopirellula bahusiensis TaxID=2014065 RepID=UPI003297B867
MTSAFYRSEWVVVVVLGAFLHGEQVCTAEGRRDFPTTVACADETAGHIDAINSN